MRVRLKRLTLNLYYSSALANSATRASTSASLILMPFFLTKSQIFALIFSPFSGAKSKAAEHPTMAPPRNAYKIFKAFIP